MLSNEVIALSEAAEEAFKTWMDEPLNPLLEERYQVANEKFKQGLKSDLQSQIKVAMGHFQEH